MNNRLYISIALLIWLITISVIAVMVYADPTKRTVTNVYYYAVSNWFAQKELYGDNTILFHYLPHFVYLYTPFYLLDRPLGDILWRVFSLGLLVSAIYLLLKEFKFDKIGQIFLIITCLIITPSIGAIRNGQANLAFIGICLWIMLFILKHRWWAVAIALCLLTALKQTGLIFIMLVLIIYPHLWWKILAIISILLILPFSLSDVGYVLSQYKGALREMSGLAITDRRFADISGLIRPLGLTLEGPYSLVLRASAGIITALLWLYISRRYQEPLRIILLFASATAFLMLFHPMTEQNSYVIVAPSIAFVSIYFWLNDRLNGLSYTLMVMLVLLGSLPEIVRPFAPQMGLWFKPLIIVFFYFITAKLLLSCETTQKAL